MRPLTTFAVVGALLMGACSGDDTASPDPTALFPDVIEVEIEAESGGTYRFDVTISSPYDSPERYADAWRILDLDGNVHGTRELAHHHAGEQPFTRSLSGVDLPADVDSVVVEGRDLIGGWGGATVDAAVPRPPARDATSD
jgi:hypothetical protein